MKKTEYIEEHCIYCGERTVIMIPTPPRKPHYKYQQYLKCCTCKKTQMTEKKNTMYILIPTLIWVK